MKISANEHFEIVADLYYQRYGRLAPGKSEPPELGIDSNSEENQLQFQRWLVKQAWDDAISRIAQLLVIAKALEE